jgi:hypothetical protein
MDRVPLGRIHFYFVYTAFGRLPLRGRLPSVYLQVFRTNGQPFDSAQKFDAVRISEIAGLLSGRSLARAQKVGTWECPVDFPIRLSMHLTGCSQLRVWAWMDGKGRCDQVI